MAQSPMTKTVPFTPNVVDSCLESITDNEEFDLVVSGIFDECRNDIPI